GVDQFLAQTNLVTRNIIVLCFFDKDEIKMLLNQYSDQYSVNLDINKIAEDIFEYTNGHKGLVGTCCKAIETE
ncbi:3613_t:CDS:1, partial [Racocetra fulgida]